MEKIKKYIPDNWPFYVACALTFFAIIYTIEKTESHHSQFKYRIDYQTGRFTTTQYTDTITQTGGQIFFKDDQGREIQVSGNFSITKQ
jgi:hypothetical protein